MKPPLKFTPFRPKPEIYALTTRDQLISRGLTPAQQLWVFCFEFEKNRNELPEGACAKVTLCWLCWCCRRFQPTQSPPQPLLQARGMAQGWWDHLPQMAKPNNHPNPRFQGFRNKFAA